MRAILAALLLVACTPSAPSPTKASEPPPVPTAPVVVEPEPAKPGEATHWHWDENEHPFDLPDGWRITGDGPLRLQRPGLGSPSVDVEIPGSEHHDAAALAIHEGALYVVHYASRSSGATLGRFDGADGHVEWTTNLRALGSIDHEKYSNEVQIRIQDDSPIVFGNEASGQYTEIVDADLGITILHGEPPQVLTQLDWVFGRTRGSKTEWGSFPVEGADVPENGNVDLVGPQGTFRFREATAEGAKATVELANGDSRVWRAELPGDSFCGRAALHELFGTLWVVRWCAIASGAELVGIDAKSGDVRVSRHLRALPDVAHSKYLAAVQLRDIAGYLVVMGNEVGGHYLEAVHPNDGHTVVSRTWK
jgi:hypothetical protein